MNRHEKHTVQTYEKFTTHIHTQTGKIKNKREIIKDGREKDENGKRNPNERTRLTRHPLAPRRYISPTNFLVPRASLDLDHPPEWFDLEAHPQASAVGLVPDRLKELTVHEFPQVVGLPGHRGQVTHDLIAEDLLQHGHLRIAREQDWRAPVEARFAGRVSLGDQSSIINH